MHSSALAQTLAASPVFAKVSPVALDSLAAQARPITVNAGQHLFEMSAPAQYFFVVQTGRISLYRPCYNGDTKVFRVMERGDVIAQASMFLEPCRYPLSAQACVTSTLHRIAREHLLELVRQSPEFCHGLIQGMAMQLSQSINRIDLLTISNSAQRMVTYLMDLYMQQRSNWLTLPSNQNVIARQLNIVAETFSRQLNAFRRAGYIAGRHRHVFLLDIDGLCRSVNLPPPAINPTLLPTEAGLALHQPECCTYARQPLGQVSI